MTYNLKAELLQHLDSCDSLGELSLQLSISDLELLRRRIGEEFDSLPTHLQAKWADIVGVEIPVGMAIPTWKIYQRYSILEENGYKNEDAAKDLGLSPAGVSSFRDRYDDKAREMGFNVPHKRHYIKRGRRRVSSNGVAATPTPTSTPSPSPVMSSMSAEHHLTLATLGLQIISQLTELNIKAISNGQREGS